MKRQTNKLKLNFPIVPDIDYFDVIKNRQTILSLTNKDLKPLEGKKWRELSFFIQDKLTETYGTKYMPGSYNYVFQIVGDDIQNRGIMKTLSRDNKINMKETSLNDSGINKELQLIKSELLKATSGNMPVDMIIQLSRQSYEQQIKFLELQLNDKSKQIEKLEGQINDLNDELNDSETIIKQLESKTGIGQYLEIAQKLFSLKIPTGQPVTLKDSDVSNIPDEILQILGAVDYDKISDEDLKKIIGYLKQYISLLPLRN